ncbi:MAG: hypothetical protein WD771_06910 [Gemmatimonadaceae bacterium]
MTRAFLLAALLPLAGCSVFAIKPADPKPAPTTTPAPGAARPTTPPAGQPAARPTTPPAGQPAAQPATPPAATPPAGQPATPPAGQPATPPAGQPAAARPAAPAATPPAATTPAQATAAAIAAATAAVRRDSVRIAEAGTTRRRSPVYLMMMFDLHNASVRTSDGGTLQPENKTGLGSLELALQRARGGGLGLAARRIAGGDDAPTYQEVAFLMGSRRFALDLGAAQRTGFDSLTFGGGGDFDSTYTFARAGFRTRANVGNTDFSVQLRALYYIGIPLGDDALPKDELEGWSGETGLSWTWNRFPLTLNLGYRIERFKVFAVEQEVSAFTIGGGLLLGRR